MRRVLILIVITGLSLVSISNSQVVNVSVEAQNVISTVSPLLYGLNVARWDEDLFPGPSRDMLLDCDRDAIRKVKDAGFTLLKYPGGNDADHYIWNSPNNSDGEMNTDEYAALLYALGAEGFITVNFNESPELAANWVRYCNKIKCYGIKYWEVGDEQWGTWARGHTTPERYAERFIQFVKAMKGVDSTIKIAANVQPSDDPEGWTCRVLKAAGEYIDMVTFSYYPLTNKNENEDSLLASIGTYKRDYARIRHALQMTLPGQKGDSMWIVNVGYNSISGRPGPITLSIANALWVADLLGTMAELGQKMSCYWALHNSYPPGGGDYGILSEDGKNTPSYNYYVFPIFTHLFGQTLVKATSSDSSVSIYSALNGTDTLSIIAINKDRESPRDVVFNLKGFDPERTGERWVLDATYKLKRMSDVNKVSRQFELNLPSYSITVVRLLKKGTIAPSKNLALHARAFSSSYAKNGPDYRPSRAVDGKLYTRWASEALWNAKNGKDKQWFEIDLGRIQTFNDIKIFWANGYGIKFNIVCSRNGKNWFKVYDQENGHGGIEDIKLKPVDARFIKLNGIEGSKAVSSYSIYEMEVFNLK
ncbi:MAG: discoidin domain-containing protein [Candidatus Kryptoniota bacterium]